MSAVVGRADQTSINSLRSRSAAEAVWLASTSIFASSSGSALSGRAGGSAPSSRASATTVTPYDLPALALALGALVATDARRPLDLGSIPLLVAAVATRESALVAVAALVARWWCERDGGAAPRRSRPSFVAAFAAAGVATYLVLLAATDDGALWAQLALRGNVGRLYGWFGLAAMVGGWCLWRRAMVLAGLDGQGARREVRWMWLLASPYVVVALLTGYWFEVRLLLPMLVAELWVRAGAAPVAPVPPAGSGAGRDGAPELEAHG